MKPTTLPLRWKFEGLCSQTDPEQFFPERGGSVRKAKAVCGACTVQEECLEYALANGEKFGVWGGLSERERRGLRPSQPRPRHKPAECGTESAYLRHKRNGEEIDEECEEAYQAAYTARNAARAAERAARRTAAA